MKKFFLMIAAAIVLSLTACGSNNTGHNLHDYEVGIYDDSGEVETMWVMADYPHYESIAHLASYATDVIRVEILDERAEWLNTWLEAPPPEIDPYNLYTVYRIKVLEVFQGDAAAGDILEVRQLGGQKDGLRVINKDEVPLVVGDDLVLFLRASYIENFPSVLLNPYQSAYRFPVANEDIMTIRANETLESVHLENDLTLTVEDLVQILANNSARND